MQAHNVALMQSGHLGLMYCQKDIASNPGKGGEDLWSAVVPSALGFLIHARKPTYFLTSNLSMQANVLLFPERCNKLDKSLSDVWLSLSF